MEPEGSSPYLQEPATCPWCAYCLKILEAQPSRALGACLGPYRDSLIFTLCGQKGKEKVIGSHKKNSDLKGICDMKENVPVTLTPFFKSEERTPYTRTHVHTYTLASCLLKNFKYAQNSQNWQATAPGRFCRKNSIRHKHYRALRLRIDIDVFMDTT